MRARILLIGRETLRRSKSKLHFVLITEDIAEHVRAEVLEHFAHYPVVQHYTATDLERHFGIRGAKTIGFAKSGLAQSLYAELKQHRINRPPTPSPQGESLPQAPAVRQVRIHLAVAWAIKSSPAPLGENHVQSLSRRERIRQYRRNVARRVILTANRRMAQMRKGRREHTLFIRVIGVIGGSVGYSSTALSYR